MQLYCKGGKIVATHSDVQNVPPSAYGEGVRIIPVPNGFTPQDVGADAPTATADLLKAYAAARRYAVETGGVMIGDHRFATDRTSQAMVTGAFVQAQSVPYFTTKWKRADGSFVTVNASQLIDIGRSVLAHVSACFLKEGEVVGGIEANPPTVLTFDQVDQAFAELG